VPASFPRPGEEAVRESGTSRVRSNEEVKDLGGIVHPQDRVLRDDEDAGVPRSWRRGPFDEPREPSAMEEPEILLVMRYQYPAESHRDGKLLKVLCSL
jgi:hypothetical protein